MTASSPRRMMTKPLRLAAALTALYCLGIAQAAGGVQVTNQVFQEVAVKGEDGRIELRMAPAATVVPGTDVFYVIGYENTGDVPAEDIAVTSPVPLELEFVSVVGPAPDNVVSVDGGQNYGALTSLTVVGPDGQARPARPADVTHVRWMLDGALQPGGSGKVSFKARLK